MAKLPKKAATTWDNDEALPQEQELRWAVEENEAKNQGGVTTYFNSEKQALAAAKKSSKAPFYGAVQIAVWQEVCVKVIVPKEKDRPKPYKGHKEIGD